MSITTRGTSTQEKRNTPESTEIDEEGRKWAEKLDAMGKTDPELYDFAMHLHLYPVKSITEEIKSFVEGKELDPLSTDPEMIALEAEKSFQQGKYIRAMMGYICAIDLLFLHATVDLSEKGDESTRGQYNAKIASYSSRLREMEASSHSSSESGVLWYGLLGQYENVGKRVNEALDVVIQFYGKRLRSPVEGSGTH